MSQFEIVFPVEGSQYNDCVILQKYGDNYKLVAGIRPDDPTRTPFLKWAYPQVGKRGDNRPADKAIPIQVTLGNLVAARAMLTAMLMALPKAPEQRGIPAGKVDDSDINF